MIWKKNNNTFEFESFNLNSKIFNLNDSINFVAIDNEANRLEVISKNFIQKQIQAGNGFDLDLRKNVMGAFGSSFFKNIWKELNEKVVVDIDLEKIKIKINDEETMYGPKNVPNKFHFNFDLNEEKNKIYIRTFKSDDEQDINIKIKFELFYDNEKIEMLGYDKKIMDNVEFTIKDKLEIIKVDEHQVSSINLLKGEPDKLLDKNILYQGIKLNEEQIIFLNTRYANFNQNNLLTKEKVRLIMDGKVLNNDFCEITKVKTEYLSEYSQCFSIHLIFKKEIEFGSSFHIQFYLEDENKKEQTKAHFNLFMNDTKREVQTIKFEILDFKSEHSFDKKIKFKLQLFDSKNNKLNSNKAKLNVLSEEFYGREFGVLNFQLFDTYIEKTDEDDVYLMKTNQLKNVYYKINFRKINFTEINSFQKKLTNDFGIDHAIYKNIPLAKNCPFFATSVYNAKDVQDINNLDFNPFSKITNINFAKENVALDGLDFTPYNKNYAFAIEKTNKIDVVAKFNTDEVIDDFSYFDNIKWYFEDQEMTCDKDNYTFFDHDKKISLKWNKDTNKYDLVALKEFQHLKLKAVVSYTNKENEKTTKSITKTISSYIQIKNDYTNWYASASSVAGLMLTLIITYIILKKRSNKEVW